MKTVRYIGPATPPIVIAAGDDTVATDDNGEVKVDDTLAKTLTSQDDWESRTKTPAKAGTKED